MKKLPAIFLYLVLTGLFVDHAGATKEMPILEIERFTDQHKLSNSNINCLVQDTTGFLWIGSSYGLNKFDGSNVTRYFFDPNDSTSIGDNYIQRLFVDSRGTLWVLVPRYFCRYDEAADRFVRYKYADENKNTHTANPGGVIEDNNGHIWIGTPEMGLYCFDRNKEEVAYIAFKDDNISELAFDGEGVLWIGSVGKMFAFDTHTRQIVSVTLPKYEAIVRINLQKGYILTRNSCYMFTPQKRENIGFRQVSNTAPYIDAEILESLETNGRYWFGTKGKGLMLYNQGTDIFSVFKFQENNPNTISNNTVKCMIEDRSGVVWIGTGDGLNKYNPHRNYFAHYLHDEARNSLISNIINGFGEDNHRRIWITTYDGVSRFDPATGGFVNYASVRVNEQTMNFQNIRDVCKDFEGNLWFSHKQGLFKLNTSTDRFSFFPLQAGDVKGSDILCTCAGEQYVWAGTYGSGVFRMNCKNETVDQAFNTQNTKLSSDFVKDIIQLENGKLCFATLRTGIDIYDPATNEFRNIRFSSHTHNYVSDYINQVMQDSNKNIWVLSWYGVFVLNQEYELIRQFTANDNMAANEMTSIAEDTNGDIWLGTINGLSRISSFGDDNYHVSNYTVDDGIASNSISTGSLFLSSGQTIYLGTSNGFNTFGMQDVPINKKSVAPTITNLNIFNKPVRPGEKVNGQVVLEKQVNLQPSIRLNHRQKIISLYFSSLDFSRNKKVKYAYKLEGLEKDWVYTENESNSASYSNLYPGKYTFHVKSENTNGIWSGETMLDILVVPPWWATWWAYCMYAVLLAIAVYITIRIFVFQERLKQNLKIEKLQHEKENEINRIKFRFYTNISHDIRTPLTLIIGPLEHILKHETLGGALKGQLEVIRNNASYLLSLINQLLDFRKVETGKSSLKASQHDIAGFAGEIALAFEPYALQKKIGLRFNSDGEKMIWFDPQLMSKVLYNLIGNALKFTPENGKVDITVTSTANETIIEVADTGIGINPENQSKIFDDFYQVHHNAASMLDSYTSGSGIGLSIVKKYVELHYGHIRVKSEPDKGSTFTVALKHGSAHFEESQIEHRGGTLPNIQIPFFHLNQQLTVNNEENTEMAQAKNTDRNTILVVDDNMDIIRYVAGCLEEEFAVYNAVDGRQGLEISGEKLPDIIISDIMMPEMDGFSFVKALKNNELTSHIPILFLTAKSSLDDTLKGFELGAVDYITKPFNETILLAKIRNLIRDRNLLQEKIKDKYISHKPNENEVAETVERKIDDPFMQKITDFIRTNIEHPDFSPEMVEKHFKISKMQLYRKLKGVSGLSIIDVIGELRISKACELLTASDLNVSEIAYKIGFSDPLYFSKSFKKQMGKSPLQYRKEHYAS